MNTLFKILFLFKANNTHHRLMLDSLRLLNIENIENPDFTDNDLSNFIDLMLFNNEALLRGAVAPDYEFKDYKNHVIYVWDKNWGGASDKAKEWHKKFVEAMNEGDWEKAAYSLGVFSHYFTDPVQPLHTGQIEGEGRVHKWVEVAVWERYREMQYLIENKYGGYPKVRISKRKKDWIDWLIKKGARFANHYYEFTLKHYSVEHGYKKPAMGMDDDLLRIYSFMVGHAVAALTAVIEKTLSDVNPKPPQVDLKKETIRQFLKIPKYLKLRREIYRRDREKLEEIEREFQEKKKVSESLPEDDKAIREIYCVEVRELEIKDLKNLLVYKTGRKYSGTKRIKGRSKLKRIKPNPESEIAILYAKKIKRKTEKSLVATWHDYALDWENLPPVPKKKGKGTRVREVVKTPRTREYKLYFNDPVEKVPEMKKVMAKRLREIGIETAHHFIMQKPEELVKKLRMDWVTQEMIDRMQNEALMMTHLPKLYAYHAKLLYLAGYTSIYRMQEATPQEIYEAIQRVLQTKEGKRALQTGKPPTRGLIRVWLKKAEMYHVI